jgi:hypothetical protein
VFVLVFVYYHEVRAVVIGVNGVGRELRIWVPNEPVYLICGVGHNRLFLNNELCAYSLVKYIGASWTHNSSFSRCLFSMHLPFPLLFQGFFVCIGFCEVERLGHSQCLPLICVATQVFGSCRVTSRSKCVVIDISLNSPLLPVCLYLP